MGGATISERMSQSIGPAAKKAMLSARLSNGSYIHKMELDENVNVQLQTLKQDVFVDKRAPQGQKLFKREGQSPGASAKHPTVSRAANLGFALSPLARRGQQVIALGSARTRPG